MGEARQRGTFEERKAQSIARKEEADRVSAETEAKRLAAMTAEEREQEEYCKIRARKTMLNIHSAYHALTRGTSNA